MEKCSSVFSDQKNINCTKNGNIIKCANSEQHKLVYCKTNDKQEGNTVEERAEHLSQFGVVNQVRSVSVDESTQSQAVLPAEPQKNKGKHQRDGGRKVVEEGRGVRRLQLRKGGEL